MEILLASNNTHKHDEFKRLFPGHSLLMPRDLGIEFGFEENGRSFLENALGKAQELYRASRRPVLADDSGLCVRALGGEPGIYSNRYGAVEGKSLGARERNAYLLTRMQGIHERSAYFVCCIVFLVEEQRYCIAQETVEGTITASPRGEHGFGYDPVFLVPEKGKTIAELPDAEKDELSHRGRAARRIAGMLEGGDPWT